MFQNNNAIFQQRTGVTFPSQPSSKIRSGATLVSVHTPLSGHKSSDAQLATTTNMATLLAMERSSLMVALASRLFQPPIRVLTQSRSSSQVGELSSSTSRSLLLLLRCLLSTHAILEKSPGGLWEEISTVELLSTSISPWDRYFACDC
jgi:hypothetical protein